MSHRFIALLLVFPVLVHAAPLPKDKPPKPKTPGEVIIGTLQHEAEGRYTFTYTSYTQQPVYTQELVTTIVDGVEETNTVNVVTLIPEAKQIKINLPSKALSRNNSSNYVFGVMR